MTDLPNHGDDDPRPVALVLGAAVWPGGIASPTLRRRAEKAAALWQAGTVRAIVACGAIGQNPPSEASVIAALCRQAGVPEAALFQEERSRTTEQNLRFARPFLDALGTRRVLIVTDLWHGPRARLVARRQGLEAKVAALPLRGARLRSLVKGALREVPAFAWYWLTGRGL